MGFRSRSLAAAALCSLFAGGFDPNGNGSLYAQDAPRITLYEPGLFAWQDSVPIPRAAPRVEPYPPPLTPFPPPPPPPPPPRPPLSDRFEIRFEYGAGEMEHETRGSNLDGETDARFVRLQFEGYGYAGIGGGVRIEGSASDDDLFADTVGEEISASASEVFLYLAFRLDGGRLRFPLRAGMSYHELVIADDLLDVDVEYTTWALRFEGEPEIEIVSGDSLRFSAYSLFGIAFGPTDIDTDPSSIDDDAGAFLLGFEIGARLEWGPALFGLGYLYRLADIDEGDDFFFAVTNEFSGLLLSVGLRW